MTARGALGGALAAGVVAAMVLRPLAHGVPGLTVAAFWATALGQVVVPGVLLCLGARLSSRRDPWLVLGQGATLGLAIQGLSLLAGRALGAHGLPTLVATATAVAGLALRAGGGRRRRAARPPAAPGSRSPSSSPPSWCSRSPRLGAPRTSRCRSTCSSTPEPRASCATAGRCEDPRAAGHPAPLPHARLRPSGGGGGRRRARRVADTLLALAPLLWVALLALQVANAGRVLFRDARAGALGAAVALFHADPGGVLGLGPGAFNSHLATGIYGSPTTACGLLLLAGLAISLDGWLELGGRRHLATLALVAAAASAAKTTVLPVAIGGIALAAAHAWRAGRPADVRRLVAALS